MTLLAKICDGISGVILVLVKAKKTQKLFILSEMWTTIFFLYLYWRSWKEKTAERFEYKLSSFPPKFVLLYIKENSINFWLSHKNTNISIFNIWHSIWYHILILQFFTLWKQRKPRSFYLPLWKRVVTVNFVILTFYMLILHNCCKQDNICTLYK